MLQKAASRLQGENAEILTIKQGFSPGSVCIPPESIQVGCTQPQSLGMNKNPQRQNDCCQQNLNIKPKSIFNLFHVQGCN